MSSDRLRWSVVVLAMMATGMIVATASGSTGSATRPATDAVTESLLRELDAVPASDAAAGTRVPRDGAAHVWRWWSLLHLFAAPLATAAALGVAGGMLGVFVLLRREALVALAMPQVVAAGAALGMALGWPTLPPSLLVATAALVYLALSQRGGTGAWVLPSLYVAGLSISFLLIANRGQDVGHLEHLLTGVDVAVSTDQALLAVPLLLAAGIVGALLWRRWLLLAQVPATAELARLRPVRWDTLFLALLTAVLLLGTNSLGVIMVLAMLFLPAAAALPWAKRVPQALIGAAVVALAMLIVGFYLSNQMDWPLSRSVGGVGFAMVMVSQVVRWIVRT